MTDRLDKLHIGRIKSLPCACCGKIGPSSAHHLRAGMGTAQRNDDWITIPLCHDCHQGKHGVHGDQAYMRTWKKTELSMLAWALKTLYGRSLRTEEF